MQFGKKTTIALAFLLILQFAISTECNSIEFHKSIVIEGENAKIVVLVSCNGMALADKTATIVYPSGKTIEARTGANGEISIQPSEEGTFFFTLSGEGGGETKISFETPIKISMLRTGDTFTICVDKPIGQIEIIDNNITKILPLEKSNCTTYTSISRSFEVKATTESGKTFKAIAGKILSIEAPETVNAGEGFIVKALDNFQPAENAKISFMGEQKTTGLAGDTVFFAKQAGEFEIIAEKEGLEKAVKKIIVLAEPEKLSVEFPKTAKPGEIIKVLVSSKGNPIENARIELGETIKTTGKDGTAFFAIPAEGSAELKVSAPNFQAFSSLIEIKKEAIKPKNLEIFAPEKIVAGQPLEVQVKSEGRPVEAAKISVSGIEKTTNSNGIAMFEGLSPGNIEIIAVKDGFNSASQTIEVTAPIPVLPENTFGILAVLILLLGLLVLILGVVRVVRKRRQFG
ncbi:MAG: hypothetical protein QXK06_02120 [Candidatus Diapherotrites archaeon]